MLLLDNPFNISYQIEDLIMASKHQIKCCNELCKDIHNRNSLCLYLKNVTKVLCILNYYVLLTVRLLRMCQWLETAKKVEKHPVYEKQILWRDQSHTKICFWMRAKFVENSFRVLISFLTRKQLRRPMCLYYEMQSIFCRWYAFTMSSSKIYTLFWRIVAATHLKITIAYYR